jgi:hypothetical protein
VLDAGDDFLPAAYRAPGAPPAALDPGEVERRARLIATAYARMGATAFTPGEHDLAVGPPLLRRVLADAKIPVVSANLYDAAGKRLFPPDRIVDAAGLKVGIFGVTRPLPEDAALWAGWKIEARDPAAAARDEIASLRARGARLVIALLHVGNGPDERKLLAEAPGIDWAVLGHSGMQYETPEKVGSTRMLEAMVQGKQVGRVDLHVLGVSLTFADRGARAQVQTILADHRSQLEDNRRRAGETNTPAMRDYYARRKTEIEAAIARETADLAAMPAAVKGSWFENRVMPLDTKVPDHAGVAMLVGAYNRENERRAAAGKPVGVGTASHGPPAPAPGAAGAPITYAGTVACGGCHQPAVKFWSTTKHAKALEALAKVKRDRDPTCVGCHVTGYLQPGGTADLAVATARLREVGCEACHGPSMDHLTAADPAAKKATTRRKVGATVCLGCHTPDVTNGEFNYEAFLKAVVGPGHGG